MQLSRAVLFSLFSIAICVSAAAAQRPGTRRVNPRPTATPAPMPEVKATPEPVQPSGKKNERPDKQASKPIPAVIQKEYDYRYEFTQPDFITSKIVIEHNDSGSGKISFTRKDFDEPVSDPLQVSAETMEKLNAAFTALNFVESTEDYQYSRDFSNLGNVAITLRRNGKQRTAKYNWTENKEAKILMDEYRRLANQYVWMFDFNLARENQPLETPRLVNSLDSLIRRNEIADVKQMLPFLQAASNDERVPLIGRNHITKLLKQIEKQKK